MLCTGKSSCVRRVASLRWADASRRNHAAISYEHDPADAKTLARPRDDLREGWRVGRIAGKYFNGDRQAPDDFKRRGWRVLIEFATQPPLDELNDVRRQPGEVPHRLVFDLAVLSITATQQHRRIDLPLDRFLDDFDSLFSSSGTHAWRCARVR